MFQVPIPNDRYVSCIHNLKILEICIQLASVFHSILGNSCVGDDVSDTTVGIDSTQAHSLPLKYPCMFATIFQLHKTLSGFRQFVSKALVILNWPSKKFTAVNKLRNLKFMVRLNFDLVLQFYSKKIRKFLQLLYFILAES